MVKMEYKITTKMYRINGKVYRVAVVSDQFDEE